MNLRAVNYYFVPTERSVKRWRLRPAAKYWQVATGDGEPA